MDSIKMIVCDLDGTLLNNEELISTRNLNAIKKLKQQGYIFGFASGRPICSIENLMGKWNINTEIIDFIIGLNGGDVKDYCLSKEEKFFQIDGQLIKDVISHFEGYSVNFGVYNNNHLVVLKDDNLAKRLATSDCIPYIVSKFDDIYNSQQSKLIVICDPSDMTMVAKHGQKFKHPQLKSLQAGKIEYEYMHPQLSKSLGLKTVCSWHNIELNNLLAFGDADNDADMIRDAGIGVAMDNASPLTKSYANYVTLNNQEDGAAYFLEENIIKRKMIEEEKENFKKS